MTYNIAGVSLPFCHNGLAFKETVQIERDPTFSKVYHCEYLFYKVKIENVKLRAMVYE